MFAAITPILFIGSVLGRVSFKAWMVFVPLWITFAYAVNAFLLWGGGYWAGKGALDFSGGYVIHLAAGVSGFVSAAIIGPRLKRDREKAVPNNLMFVAVGAGILWLGWNGFNGGDPYFAGADAAAAIVNTNLATAVAMMTWILMDMFSRPEKKPTFLGGLNGMICGLVGITPAAGYVNGFGAIIIGLVGLGGRLGRLVHPAEVRLAVQQGRRRPRRGLHPRHRRACSAACWSALLADPNVIEYPAAPGGAAFGGAGWFWGHHPHQLLVQFLAALTIIIWDGAVTFRHLDDHQVRVPDEAPLRPTRSLRSATSRSTARRPTRRRRSSRPSSASRRRPRPRRRPRSRSPAKE